MIVQSLQVLATMVLLFAIFKRDPLHKDKFFLFWLIISAVQCTTWIILGFQYILIDFTNYDFFDFITSTLVLLSIWLAPRKSQSYLQILSISLFIICKSISVIIGYMMSLIYQEYAELVQDNRNRSLQASTLIPEVVETKEMPPPYTPPAPGQLSVSAINV